MRSLMNTHRRLTNRTGVSLVEVLFAMMIALFGLAGVLAIFPWQQGSRPNPMR